MKSIILILSTLLTFTWAQANDEMPALLVSSASSYDYGTNPVGGISTHTFFITNPGYTEATNLSFTSLIPPFSFFMPGTTCGHTLKAGENCRLVVDFLPYMNGSFNDTVEISYFNGGAHMVLLVDVTGNSVAPANLVISDGPTYDFGDVKFGESNSKMFTVTNTGGYIATNLAETGIDGLAFSLLGGYPGTGGTCGGSLAPGASCTIALQFTPAYQGVYTDTIEFRYYDGVKHQLSTRTVGGVGVL